MKWSQVKVWQLPEIQKLIDFKSDDMVEVYDRDIALLALVTGKSEDYFGSLKPKEFGEYRKELRDLISTQPTSEFNPILKVGGRTFSTIVSVNQTTMDKVADIHLLDITGANYYSKLPFILAVFAKEKRGWKFWRKKLSFTQKAELFKEAPADIANSISLFFCTVSPVLEKAIRNSLEKQIQIQVDNLNEAIAQHSIDGDGLQRSTTSQMETARKRRHTSK